MPALTKRDFSEDLSTDVSKAPPVVLTQETSPPEEKEDRLSVHTPRALLRDVILGVVAVVCVSVAVPAWIIHVEYHKTSNAPMKPISAAEVLRETRSETVVVIRPAIPNVLELAERIVQQEAEEREAKRRATVPSLVTRSPDNPVPPKASPAAIPSVVNTPPVDSRDSVQSP
jgi:hypothetical protein